MSDPEVSAQTLARLEGLAGVLRAELGAEIDAYPGASTPEQADPFNRAFRAVVRDLLRTDGTSDSSRPDLVSRTLRLLAEHRLALEGWDQDQIRLLITQEPGSPDDWLAFLVLSSRAQIEPLLDPEES